MLLSAQLGFAVDVGDQGIISQLQKVREQLRQSAGASTDCKTPDAANCNFQDYCQQFASKGKDFYLYQNAEGRQIYNNQLINYMSSAEVCLGKAFPQAPVRDPFVYPEQLINPDKAGGAEKMRENFSRYQQENKRTEKIFNEVQDRMVRLLESRRNKENKKAIDNMLARITTVKISMAQTPTEIANLSIKGCDIPNAGYEIGTHKITVCPQLMNLPDATLFSIIAHELTHSIDPCAMSISYSRVNGVISQDIVDFGTPEAAPLDSFLGPIKASTNPFKSVISCLQKPESMGVKLPSKEEVISTLREQVERGIDLKTEVAETNDDTSADPTDMLRASLEEKVNGIDISYPEFNQCYNLSGTGHPTEAFADWMSSQLLKQKISDIPDSGKAKTYAAESQMFFMATSCKNISQAAAAAVRPLIQKKCPGLLEIMKTEGKVSDETDTHPDTSKRITRIMYAPATIQKALGCKKDPGLIECK